jgi:DNA replication protein
MKNHERQRLRQGIALAMDAGYAAVPGLLLKHYKEMGLNDGDVILYIHLLYFSEWEKKEFPTLDEICARMSASKEEVVDMLQRLIKSGFLEIEDSVDEATGVHFERYRCRNMLEKLAEHAALLESRREEGAGGIQAHRRAAAVVAAFVSDDRTAGKTGTERGESGATGAGAADASVASAASGISGISGGPGASGAAGERKAAATTRRSIFSAFEAEFARPLSPLEYETIVDWLDRDRYPEELILLALKEAVFAGKVYFKYIDRILLEWEKNRVRTVEQAKEYAQRFRGR